MNIAAKLPTSCDGCGACCMHAQEPPFAGVNGVAAGPDPYWDNLPEFLKLEIESLRSEVQSNSRRCEPCLWLDLATKRCRHYEHRPKLCRDFELGGEECLGFRSLYASKP